VLVTRFSVNGCLHRLCHEPVPVGPHGSKEATVMAGTVLFEPFDRLLRGFDLSFEPLLPFLVHGTLISARGLAKGNCP
jgi:hypothetical protein